MTKDRARMDWCRCQADSDCTGSALPPWSRCLAHLDSDNLEQAIKRAKTNGLDARGVSITSALLERILSLLDRTDRDRPIVPISRFDKATLTGAAGFTGATFSKDTRFDGTGLSGQLSFQSARPAKVAVRGSSTGEIESTVDLKEALFAGPAVVSTRL